MVRFRIAHLYLTRRCPHKCNYCGVVAQSQDRSASMWDQIIGDIDPFCGEYNILGGEPLVHKEFWKILKLIQATGKFFTVSTSLTTASNLKLLADAGVRSISVSMDSLESTGDRGADNKALVGRTALDSWRGEGPNFCGIVVNPSYTDRALAAARYASDRGWLCCMNPINVNSDDTVFGSKEFVESVLFADSFTEKLLSEARKGNIRLSDPEEFYHSWDKPWNCSSVHSLAVDFDGFLYPCISLHGPRGRYDSQEILSFIDDYLDIISGCHGCNMNSSWTADMMPEDIW